MDRGLLDAAGLNNPSSDLQLGLPEVAKVYMLGSHHRPAGAFEIVFNKAKHDALPAEIKSILRHAAFAASAAQLGMAYARYPKDLDEIGKRGVNVVRTGRGGASRAACGLGQGDRGAFQGAVLRQGHRLAERRGSGVFSLTLRPTISARWSVRRPTSSFFG